MQMCQIKIPLDQPRRLSGAFIERRSTSLNSYHFRANSGQHFIIKKQSSLGNRRSLISEWVANRLLAQLGFVVPRILEALVPPNTILAPEDADKSILAIHYPCNPEVHAVFDMMPDALGHKVSNSGDFVGIQLADWLLHNTGPRHALFVPRIGIEPQFLNNAENLTPVTKGYVGVFIGNSHCFGGSDWDSSVEVQKSFYPRPWSPTEHADVREYWVAKILGIATHTVEEAFQSIPPAWVGEDDLMALSCLKQRLLGRAKQLDFDSALLVRKPVQHAARAKEPEAVGRQALVQSA
jgi:hypothetical protein